MRSWSTNGKKASTRKEVNRFSREVAIGSIKLDAVELKKCFTVR